MTSLTDDLEGPGAVRSIVLNPSSNLQGAVLLKTVPFCPRQAELEWSVLERQCLGQRLDSLERLRSEVGAWETERNARKVKVKWQFGVLQAREKLRRHYPKLEVNTP